MDRVIVYPNALPRALDVLRTGKYGLVSVAKLSEAVLGTGTVVDGFACTQTTPATLSVNLGPGQIYQQAPAEQTAISALTADPTLVQKQGIAPSAQLIGLTPPTSPGQSVCYLIQAQYLDTDTGKQTLNFYNAANPAVPLSGPSGNGEQSFTIRSGAVQIVPKAGIVTTGTPVAPAPDAGYVGLYVVTLTYNQQAILQNNIAIYANAPFIPAKLPDLPAAVQSGKWVYALDFGTAGALAASLYPTPASLVDGMSIRVLTANPAVGGDTATIAGSAALPIRRRGGAPAVAGDWSAGDIITLTKSGASWQLGSLVRSDLTTIINTLKLVGGVPQRWTTPGTATLNLPAGVTFAITECRGGGGGGGGASSTSAAASGGGGGGLATKVVTTLTAVALTITIGAAGSGGVGGTTPGAGSAGGTTSVTIQSGQCQDFAGNTYSAGATLCAATGGGGGSQSTGGPQNTASGAGGVASGGDTNDPGEKGGYGYLQGPYIGGSGGASPGGGFSQPNYGDVGQTSSNPGTGGSGSSTNGPGGNGSPGRVTIVHP